MDDSSILPIKVLNIKVLSQGNSFEIDCYQFFTSFYHYCFYSQCLTAMHTAIIAEPCTANKSMNPWKQLLSLAQYKALDLA